MARDFDTTAGGSRDSTPPLFREVQRFRQWIFMIPIVAVAAIVWYSFVQQVILDHYRHPRRRGSLDMGILLSSMGVLNLLRYK